jgi:hypothetical protein
LKFLLSRKRTSEEGYYDEQHDEERNDVGSHLRARAVQLKLLKTCVLFLACISLSMMSRRERQTLSRLKPFLAGRDTWFWPDERHEK